MPKDTFYNLNEEKQEKVMRSAIAEFVKNGFEKGNIGDIAKSAGVSKGSMYQYFENKKELFLYCVTWTVEFIMQKYYKPVELKIDIFEYFYKTSKNTWDQARQERELLIFVQDVFLGKYSGLKDESIEKMLKVSDEYLFRMIKEGQKNGSIRTDIDEKILALFVTGVSIKIKEYLMNRARAAGEDIVDEEFQIYEKEIKAMLDLLKNGMGAR